MYKKRFRIESPLFALTAISVGLPGDKCPHWNILHWPTKASVPLQGSPSIFGLGLVQVRVWIPVPPPQVALHSHLPHDDQPPSRGGPSISEKQFNPFVTLSMIFITYLWYYSEYSEILLTREVFTPQVVRRWVEWIIPPSMDLKNY